MAAMSAAVLSCKASFSQEKFLFSGHKCREFLTLGMLGLADRHCSSISSTVSVRKVSTALIGLSLMSGVGWSRKEVLESGLFPCLEGR